MKPQLDAEKAASEKLTRQLGERQKEVAAIVARRDALEELLTKTDGARRGRGRAARRAGREPRSSRRTTRRSKRRSTPPRRSWTACRRPSTAASQARARGATAARAVRPGRAASVLVGASARALAERVDACKRAVQCSRDEAAHWRRVATGSLLDGLGDLPSAVHPGGAVRQLAGGGRRPAEQQLAESRVQARARGGSSASPRSAPRALPARPTLGGRPARTAVRAAPVEGAPRRGRENTGRVQEASARWRRRRPRAEGGARPEPVLVGRLHMPSAGAPPGTPSALHLTPAEMWQLHRAVC